AAEPRRQHPIETRRRAAALQVAEDDRSRFLAGLSRERFADSRPDSAEPLRVAIARLLDQRQRPSFLKRALRDDDDAELGAPGVAVAQPLRDDGDVEWNFWDQDRVGTTRHAGVERDPP